MSKSRDLANYGSAAKADVTTSNTDTDTSRVMRPGNGGLLRNSSSPVVIESDPDALTVGGNFYLAWSGGGTLPNTTYQVQVIASGGVNNNLVQIAHRDSSGETRVFYRTRNNGTFSDWQRTDPQGFGLGGVAETINFSTLASPIDGLFVRGSNGSPLGSTTVFGIQSGDGNNYGVRFSGRDGQYFAQSIENQVISAWQELYHTGNLNVNEFGGNATDDRIMVGFARTATTVEFYASINLPFPAVPSSISVTGTFSVKDASFSTVTGGANITPLLSSGSSSKLLTLVLGGLSGLVVGEPVLLFSDSSSSKITVNS